MIFRFQGFSEGYKMPQKAAGNGKGKNCSTDWHTLLGAGQNIQVVALRNL